MSDTQKLRNPSPLVQAVLALDGHFNDLLRLGEKIEASDLKSSFDFEQAQRHLEHFTIASQGVSTQVLAMSQALNELRVRAEATASNVAQRAELIHSRHNEVQDKMREFAQLGEEVRDLNVSLMAFQRSENEELTGDDREQLKARITEIEPKLQALIGKAQALKKEAQVSRLKELEHSAESLGQRLSSIREKLVTASH